MRFRTTRLEDACVVENRLQLEDGRRVIHLTIVECVHTQVSVDVEDALTSVVGAANEELDRKRGMVNVQPLDEIN